jgi:O-acetyl-ADP-ribose deacetylase (regulator of RNase III)
VQITLVRGDITDQQVDAVVNAANSGLLGGGGVDGAIHRRGGPAILAECRQVRASRYPDGLPTGQAVATTAGELPARWVIHTVGPIWSASEDRGHLLRSCYHESLSVAAGLGARTVAFPAISTGVYGWPLADGARQALAAVRSGPAELVEVRFVLYDAAAYDAFSHAVG